MQPLFSLLRVCHNILVRGNAERRQKNEKLQAPKEHGLSEEPCWMGYCLDVPARVKFEEGERIS